MHVTSYENVCDATSYDEPLNVIFNFVIYENVLVIIYNLPCLIAYHTLLYDLFDKGCNVIISMII